MTSGRELRVATLVAAPAVAAIAELPAHSARLLITSAPVLAVMWGVTMTALIARAIQDAGRRDPPADLRPSWHQLDVLTATGSSMMWTSAAALIASGITGWASLCVLGVLGFGVVFVAATWTAVAAGGDGPWRRAAIARAIVPDTAIEGDPLREELRLTGVRIPAGMRLFVTGRAMRHGAITRYAVGSGCSLADVRLTGELGPAQRGEHCAPPLALWLGDVLGLARSQPVEHGEARFSVLPRPAAIEGARALLGAGGDDAIALPAQRQPTDGSFRIRNYAAGDDTRRIHWVRSLQTNRLVVRLPDEIPHAEPAVRLILDSDRWGGESLSCRAPGVLLDAVVRIWLGVGRALSDTGVRVTLVAVAERDGAPSVIERPLTAHTSREALRLGGRVAWQTAVPLAALVARDAAAVRQVVVTSRPRQLRAATQLRWIVVPEASWTSPELPLLSWSILQLPFPSGCADNRLSRRGRERDLREQMRSDRAIFSEVMSQTELAAFSGGLIAKPHRGRVALEVIP